MLVPSSIIFEFVIPVVDANLTTLFVVPDTVTEVPLVPEEPLEPDVPVLPLEPLVPEEPDVPLVPEEPDVPLVPDEPDVPLVPDEPLEPDVPELPEEPDVPLEPDEPLEPDVPLVPEVAAVYSVPLMFKEPVRLIEPDKIILLFSSNNKFLSPFLLKINPSTSLPKPLAAPIVQLSLLQLNLIPEATLLGVLNVALLYIELDGTNASTFAIESAPETTNVVNDVSPVT